ncbi:glutamine amidotransferase-related protein, partial [Streptomyces caniscabiei]|uniref:glutamine amidotransferase-related protein n=1 Tax=Streptomyces caniscabiei TaxID=2746961 RepID=UPI00211AE15B
MRTLLVDNYDSYTYNLFQLIAQVNGAEPVVLHNDSPDCADLDLDDFDNVVISPGPGDPTRPKDFGACAPIIESARLPVLGVCLGHQGIAAGSGAEIVRAPAARHGHLTAVRHDGRELFHGLPQDFTAVRYHSLCVREPLPPELEATAWAEDGVLMGLRHRTRPLWGVQFHPESVATEFGYELLGNFRDLTERWHHAGGSARRSGPSRSGTRLAPVGTGARPAPRPVEPRPYRLHSRIMESAVDTEAAFTRLFADSSHAFWLDSSLIDPRLSRFSFLGDASGPLSEIVRYRVGDGAVEVTAAGGPPRRVDGTVFDYLQTALRARRVESPALPVDFACGYVGYFGYELKADCGGGALQPDRRVPVGARAAVAEGQQIGGALLVVDRDQPVGEDPVRVRGGRGVLRAAAAVGL